MAEEILVFTIRSATGLLGLLCVLRLLVLPARSYRYEPTFYLIAKLTDWLIRPMNRVLPGIWGYETSPVIAATLSYAAGYMFHWWIQETPLQEEAGILVGASLVLGMAQFFRTVIYVLIAVVIVHVIISWVNPGAPLAYLFREFSDRVLAPFRRVIPPVGNFDFTPIAAIFVAQVVLIALDHMERTMLFLP